MLYKIILKSILFINFYVIFLDKIIFKLQLIINYKLTHISEDQINKYLEQLEEQNKIDDLSWKKVISKNIKYIVLTEVDDICYCINDVYSTSYIQCIEINKEDIDCIVEELTKEEILRIRELLKQSDTKNGVKKKIKEIIY